MTSRFKPTPQYLMTASFHDRFVARRASLGSLLCVGLDPDPEKIPEGYDGGDIINTVLLFLGDVVQATAPYAVAYKPNLAFFERLGSQGMILFETLIKVIRRIAPGALIIADAKRGDVGSTADFYAKAFFETYECDAVTLNPYMGLDTLAPFAAYADRASIVLCHTSNAGALDFQETGDPPLYLRVAAAIEAENRKTGNFWMVVGATRAADSIRRIRAAAPTTPFLIPGIGAQGGDLEATLAAAGPNCLINVSRALLYGAEHRDAAVQIAAEGARRLVESMQPFLK